jgi:hypothetical protein
MTGMQRDARRCFSTIREEGAQRSRHEFRPLGMETGRLALHKPDDVRGIERRECHMPTSETVVQKTADKREIVGHCGGGECAFLSQVQAELVCALLCRGLCERHRVLCRGASVAQEVQEPLQSRSIVAPGTLPLRSVSQVVLGELWCGLVYGEALLREPSAEVSRQSELQAS